MAFVMGKIAAVLGEMVWWLSECEGFRAGRPSGAYPTLPVHTHFQESPASSRTPFFSATAEALNPQEATLRSI